MICLPSNFIDHIYSRSLITDTDDYYAALESFVNDGNFGSSSSFHQYDRFNYTCHSPPDLSEIWDREPIGEQ